MPTEYMWPIDAPPTPNPVVSSPVTITPTIAALAVRRGILAPLRRDQKNDFANGTGAELLRSHLEQILGVRAGNGAVAGEYRWRFEFGAMVSRLRHRNVDPTFRELMRTFVVEAVTRWTSLIRVTDVVVFEDPDPATMNRRIVRITYVGTARGSTDSGVLDVPLAA